MVQTVKVLALLALLFFCYLMFKIIVEYYPINTDVGFLRIKQDYIHITPWLTAFYIHVFSSLFVLMAGLTQFSSTIRSRFGRAHRWLGRAYVINILLITGPAGLFMSFYANGGISSRTAFTVLSCLWWYVTYTAWWSVLHKDFVGHQHFMLRSFALTLSAVTLRLWKMGLASYFDIPPMDLYRIVAWLGFVPNILIAELMIRKGWGVVVSRQVKHKQN